jgi:hypothetical protein
MMSIKKKRPHLAEAKWGLNLRDLAPDLELEQAVPRQLGRLDGPVPNERGRLHDEDPLSKSIL